MRCARIKSKANDITDTDPVDGCAVSCNLFPLARADSRVQIAQLLCIAIAAICIFKLGVVAGVIVQPQRPAMPPARNGGCVQGVVILCARSICMIPVPSLWVLCTQFFQRPTVFCFQLLHVLRCSACKRLPDFCACKCRHSCCLTQHCHAKQAGQPSFDIPHFHIKPSFLIWGIMPSFGTFAISSYCS